VASQATPQSCDADMNDVINLPVGASFTFTSKHTTAMVAAIKQ
jgi:hypothetical protein